MKFFLVFSFLFLANCANQTIAIVPVNSSNQNISTNQVANKIDTVAESQRNNKENVEKLEIQNEKFKTVPEEFTNVDFENFTYPINHPKKSVTLKDGEFKYETKPSGGGWFSFSKVYFVDLTGDNKNEAVVFLWQVDCGVSCDGGSAIIYFYAAQKNNPKLIGKIQTGAHAASCALKSLTIKIKKITIEQFGKCTKNTEHPDKLGEYSCKFCVNGLTNSVFKIFNSRLTKESIETADTAEQNIMNYMAEVSINDRTYAVEQLFDKNKE